MSPMDDQYGVNNLPYTGTDISGLLIIAAVILVLGIALYRSFPR